MNLRNRHLPHTSDLSADCCEPGYLDRLALIFRGLRQPRDSRVYKEAVIETQRLSAPVSAVLLPALAVALLALLSVRKPLSDPTYDITVLEPGDTAVLEDPALAKTTDGTPDVELYNQLLDNEIQHNVDTPAAAEPVRAAPLYDLSAVRNIPGTAIFKGLPSIDRAAGVRTALLERYHGGQQTEDAVMRALRWLKKNQQPDGSWNKNKVAMTSLAVLTYLAHDEKPGASPEFGSAVQAALEYLLSVQNTATGRLPGNYDHPIAAYALCEAYGMTLNPNVKAAAERALVPLIKGQHPTGGWTYQMDPGVDKETGTYRDDTSYMGWCVQALKAAQMAGLRVEGLERASKLAVRGFKRNASPNGGFGYTAPGAGGLTGVGTLCLQLLGAGDAREVRQSLDLMDGWLPSLEAKGPLGTSLQYYCYYATQCKFHSGGKRWENWNKVMKTVYVQAQQVEKNAIKDPNGNDCDIGWWINGDAHTDRPVMDTCLAALQLMVYYRYLPTTRIAAVSAGPELRAAATETGDIPVEAPGNL